MCLQHLPQPPYHTHTHTQRKCIRTRHITPPRQPGVFATPTYINPTSHTHTHNSQQRKCIRTLRAGQGRVAEDGEERRDTRVDERVGGVGDQAGRFRGLEMAQHQHRRGRQRNLEEEAKYNKLLKRKQTPALGEGSCVTTAETMGEWPKRGTLGVTAHARGRAKISEFVDPGTGTGLLHPNTNHWRSTGPCIC